MTPIGCVASTLTSITSNEVVNSSFECTQGSTTAAQENAYRILYFGAGLDHARLRGGIERYGNQNYCNYCDFLNFGDTLDQRPF